MVISILLKIGKMKYSEKLKDNSNCQNRFISDKNMK